MITIAAIIFYNDKGKLLLYQRDNRPGIAFPLLWDLFGGHVEEGEDMKNFLREEIVDLPLTNILKDIILDYLESQNN